MRSHPPCRSTATTGLALAALIFLFLPLVLTGVGVRARPLENRPLAPWPGLRDPGKVSSSLERALAERLPLRELAVRGDAWVDRSVFGEDPAFGQANPKVVAGSGDALFLAGELENACRGGVGPRQAVAMWDTFLRLIRDSGRKVAFIVAPDKSTVWADRLPAGALRPPCAANREQLWQAARAAQLPGWVDARRSLEQRGDGVEPIYFERDSHWTPYGAAIALEGVLTTLDKARWGSVQPERGRERAFTMELPRLLGRHTTEVVPTYWLDDPNARQGTQLARDPDGVGRWSSPVPAPDAGGPPTRALLIHDSFGNRLIPDLARFFPELHTAHWAEGVTMATMWREIAAADVVIVETVEREAYFRPDNWCNDHALEELRQVLDRP